MCVCQNTVVGGTLPLSTLIKRGGGREERQGRKTAVLIIAHNQDGTMAGRDRSWRERAGMLLLFYLLLHISACAARG